MLEVLDRIRLQMNKINSSNAWVFVSHSNKDFEKIIKLRNKLEDLQYKPLLFFLKCLEDDDEIFELIKREIKARDRFILCDSRNSRESVWVQREIEFIKSLHRPYEIINLDGSEESIERSIKQFDQRSTVYIWSSNEIIANAVSQGFIQKAFKVKILTNTDISHYFYQRCGLPVEGLEEIVGNGYVIFVISRKLTDNEIYFIDNTLDFFRKNARQCRFFVVSKDGLDNADFFLELKNWHGITPKIIHQETIEEKNFEKDSQIIVERIVEYDLSLFYKNSE